MLQIDLLSMNPMDILMVLLLVSIGISTLIVIENKNLIYSVLVLALMATLLGLVFFMLYAPFVAVFQIAVYAGVLTILFMTAIMLVQTQNQSGMEGVD